MSAFEEGAWCHVTARDKLDSGSIHFYNSDHTSLHFTWPRCTERHLIENFNVPHHLIFRGCTCRIFQVAVNASCWLCMQPQGMRRTAAATFSISIGSHVRRHITISTLAGGSRLQ
jgi:hypothetical protein